MAHILTVVGLGMEIVGSALLSYDLLKSKTDEDEHSSIQQLQAEIENASQQLIVRMNSGLRKLAELFGHYLAVVEVDFEKQHPASPSAVALASDPQLANIMEKGRVAAVAGLLDAQKFLPDSASVNDTLAKISKARQEIEARFSRQIAAAKRLRRIAVIGVLLVGIGGVCEFADLTLFPERSSIDVTPARPTVIAPSSPAAARPGNR